MMITGFNPFRGEHCETTALGNLLQHQGMNFSEPMLFGLGQGLSFIYWDMKKMSFPFLGGRTKPQAILETFCRSMNIPIHFSKSTSPQRAWQTLEATLAGQQPLGLKLDCYYLDYFTHKVHFAAHYAVVYGYDSSHAYLADTAPQGPLAKTTLATLAQARNAKGPMSTPNLSFAIQKPEKLPKLDRIILNAVKENAKTYLTPPIKNVSYLGIHKAGQEVLHWFKRSARPEIDFPLCANLMEYGGTGGGLFRKLYSRFLKEAGDLLNHPKLAECAEKFSVIAGQWTQAADLIRKAGTLHEEKYLHQVSDLLFHIAEEEKQVMTRLAG